MYNTMKRSHTAAALTVEASLSGIVLGMSDARLERGLQHLADRRHVRAGRRVVAVAGVVRLVFVPGGQLQQVWSADRRTHARKTHGGMFSFVVSPIVCMLLYHVLTATANVGGRQAHVRTKNTWGGVLFCCFTCRMYALIPCLDIAGARFISRMSC